MPNFDRRDMPQVDTQNLRKALNMASDMVKVTKETIVASKLKKSQKQLYKDKVVGIANRFTTPQSFKPLIISKDNHIVDGHHRWGAAIYKWGDNVKLPVYRINLSVENAIKLYKHIANTINEILESLKESIMIPIEIGDTVLGGKFKNKRIVVKSIDTNEKGDITINGKPLLKYRLVKESNAVSGGKVHKFITGKNLTYKGKKYSEIDFELVRIDNTSELVHLKVLAPKQIFGSELKVPFKTIRRGPFLKTDTSKQFEGTINEIPMADLQKIDSFADKQLNPVNVVLTDKHFFDRLNDPRNEKEITSAELIGFFKRLSKKKNQFLDFLNKYNQIVATDDRTNINIPFMQKVNSVIAKTVMRKKDFKTPNKRLEI